MRIFVPITKVDATKREVWGRAVQEMRDEVLRRREITSVDAVADTTEYWASDWERLLTDISAKYATVSPAEYAKIHGGVPASVRRWCAHGEIAGAQQDAAGEWRIPRGAGRRRRITRRRPSPASAQ